MSPTTHCDKALSRRKSTLGFLRRTRDSVFFLRRTCMASIFHSIIPARCLDFVTLILWKTFYFLKKCRPTRSCWPLFCQQKESFHEQQKSLKLNKESFKRVFCSTIVTLKLLLSLHKIEVSNAQQYLTRSNRKDKQIFDKTSRFAALHLCHPYRSKFWLCGGAKRYRMMKSCIFFTHQDASHHNRMWCTVPFMGAWSTRVKLSILAGSTEFDNTISIKSSSAASKKSQFDATARDIVQAALFQRTIARQKRTLLYQLPFSFGVTRPLYLQICTLLLEEQSYLIKSFSVEAAKHEISAFSSSRGLLFTQWEKCGVN